MGRNELLSALLTKQDVWRKVHAGQGQAQASPGANLAMISAVRVCIMGQLSHVGQGKAASALTAASSSPAFSCLGLRHRKRSLTSWGVGR